MQYQTTNRRERAAAHRRAAREAEAYGLPGLAEVDWEMAEWLDPTPRVRKPRRSRAYS